MYSKMKNKILYSKRIFYYFILFNFLVNVLIRLNLRIIYFKVF